MSFWRFGFTSQSSIETILSNLHQSGPQDLNSSDSEHSINPSSIKETVLPLVVTLDQLLEEDDLLQECKSGHSKLADFLGKPVVVKRMLQYIDGSAFQRDLDKDIDVQEQPEKLVRKRQRYPQLCAEIIICNVHSVVQEILVNLETYLPPFWGAILDRDSVDVVQDSVQAAHWSKVNCHLLSEHTSEVLACFRSQPELVGKLIQHITSPAVADYLFKFIQAEETRGGQGIIDYLSGQRLMQSLVALMSPRFPVTTHAVVSDFIKGIISFCSTANANAGNAEFAPNSNQVQQQAQNKWAQATREAAAAEGARHPSVWVSHALLRDLASEETIKLLLKFMLDERPGSSTLPRALDALSLSSSQLEVATPRAEKKLEDVMQLSSTNLLQLPSQLVPPLVETQATPASVTSSIRNCLSIIIDLIRQNNSDFTEQQILHYLRKKQALSVLEGSEKLSQAMVAGPSVVDLGHVLSIVSSRLEELQRLLIALDADTKQIEMPLGLVSPLTIERFRMCELYAEMLHCSNMGLLNRPRTTDMPVYNSLGTLVGGLDSLPILESALTNPQAPASPDLPHSVSSSTSANTSTYASSLSGMSDGSLQLPNGIEEVSFGSDSVTSSPVMENTPAPAVSRSSTRDTLAEVKLNGHVESLESAASPGQRLKIAFIKHAVVKSMLQLFFDHPWHNFLHNVVYDLIQQLFNGRLEHTLDRKLCLNALLDGQLIKRVLDAQEENSDSMKSHHRRRLGYMGHLSLIAEEALKLFVNRPEIADEAAQEIPQPSWDAFVSGSLKETREKDLQHLGGGITSVANDTLTSAGSILSDDEEDAQAGNARGWRSIKNDGLDSLTAPRSVLSEYDEIHPTKSPPQVDQDPMDKLFVRRKSNGSASSSSSEEDDRAGPSWPKVNNTGYNPRSADIQPTTNDSSEDSDSDDDFGSFSTAPVNNARPNTLETKSSKTNLTAADWNSEFKSSFTFSPENKDLDNPFATAEDDELDEDDFGEFATASPPVEASPRRPSAFGPSSSFSFGFDDTFDGEATNHQRRPSLEGAIDSSRERLRPDGLVAVHVSDQDGDVIVPADELSLASTEEQAELARSPPVTPGS